MVNFKYKNLGLRRINKLCKHFGYNKLVKESEYDYFVRYIISGKYLLSIMFFKFKKKIKVDIYTHESDTMESYYIDHIILKSTEFYKVYQIVKSWLRDE